MSMGRLVVFAPILFWATIVRASFACDVPWNVQIIANDSCAKMEHVEWAFEEVRKWAWYAGYAREPVRGERNPFPNPRLEWMGPIQIEFRPGETFAIGAGKTASGTFNPINPFALRIVVAEDSEFYPFSLAHEMGHWFFYRFQEIYGRLAWLTVGHGVKGDILTETINDVIKVFFEGLPETHSYHPGYVGQCVIQDSEEVQ